MTDWIFGAIGGLMIGLAGAVYLLGNGRIMGASGILGGLVDGSAKRDQRTERIAFLAGLVLVPLLLNQMSGASATTQATQNLALLISGGLLVGLGTRIGNGCTSGHGVCGISRLSLRGIVATLFYIGAGAVTVTLMRTLAGVG